VKRREIEDSNASNSDDTATVIAGGIAEEK
jgi:hypothetical protein